MRKYFLTGLALLLPIALTMMVILFLFDLFTAPFVNIVGNLLEITSKKASFALPPDLAVFISRLLALFLLLLFILLLGVLARWFLVKNLLAAANRLLSRIPIIKTVYMVSRDIIAALFSSDGKKAFKCPVMFPFPHPSIFSIGFQAGEVAEEIRQKLDASLVSVFAPTAPHPISGFLLFVPEKDVHKVDMTNEDAVKFLVSCGLIHPHSNARVDDEIL